jgi:hypothetical protein
MSFTLAEWEMIVHALDSAYIGVGQGADRERRKKLVDKFHVERRAATL